jgi:phage shock protein A
MYDLPDLTELPPGQRRAMEALIGGGTEARTYIEAADVAKMSVGTMKTHVNRVREKHPKLYEQIREVRKAQLAARHRTAMANAQAHSRAYFRNLDKRMKNALGFTVWDML